MKFFYEKKYHIAGISDMITNLCRHMDSLFSSPFLYEAFISDSNIYQQSDDKLYDYFDKVNILNYLRSICYKQQNKYLKKRVLKVFVIYIIHLVVISY